jgi:hypothetical protein
MATYSSNVTMKVSAAISAASITDGATLYTAPANGYAIIQASIQVVGGSDTGEMRVGGQPVLSAYGISGSDARSSTFGVTNTGGPSSIDGAQTGFFHERGIYVGPGQTVTWHTNNSRRARISGVEFINTP